MANLILKASSGNSLVVQGGDASPAITVGNTGLATFAENATLSGTANNLGTVTAGTLGSAVVFPAGHVVQAHEVEFDAVTSETTINSWTTLTGVSLPFTPNHSNSKIHGDFSISWGTYSSDTIVNFRIIRVISGGGTTVVHEHGNTSGGAATFRGQTQGLRSMFDNNGGNHTNLSFFDTPGVDTLITYTLQYYRTQSGTTYINRNYNDDPNYGRGSTIMSCMEIKV